jgi:hypothetical protein
VPQILLGDLDGHPPGDCMTRVRVLPLRRALNLAQRAIVEFLLAASGGLTGEVSRLLNEAAELAIGDATERITLRHLEHLGHVVV